METLSKFTYPGLGLLLTLATGFWLTGAGKPLNAAIFTIHKLIALAAVVLTVVQLAKVLKIMDVQALLILLLVVVALGVIVLFASGALMSAGKLSYGVMLTIHRIAPVVVILAFAAELYFLIGRAA